MIDLYLLDKKLIDMNLVYLKEIDARLIINVYKD